MTNEREVWGDVEQLAAERALIVEKMILTRWDRLSEGQKDLAQYWMDMVYVNPLNKTRAAVADFFTR